MNFRIPIIQHLLLAVALSAVPKASAVLVEEEIQPGKVTASSEKPHLANW